MPTTATDSDPGRTPSTLSRSDLTFLGEGETPRRTRIPLVPGVPPFSVVGE